jgi:signal transduction histidine kinase
MGAASNLVLLAYLVDTWVRAERSPDAGFARRARVVCLTWIAAVLVMGGMTLLLSAGELHGPFVASLGFTLVIAATSIELGWDVNRSETLAGRLLSTRQDLELAANAGGLALWTWDPDPKAPDAPGSFEIWGLEAGDPIAMTLEDFLARVHPEDREGLRASFAAALAGRAPIELECRMFRGEGELRWVLVRGAFDADAAPAPAHMRGVVQDITERREMATQRDKLARLSRITMLGELLASLSHEINQPLTAIMANAQAGQRVLDREPVDVDELRDILVEIVADDHRAGRIIAGLRELFRDERPSQVPVDLNAVVAEVLRLLRHFLATHHVHVTLELTQALPPVIGDHVQLEQVLLNLVVNACEAMASQPERRTLCIQSWADEARVNLCVVDSGRGIPQQDLQRIFDSFVTTRLEGLGLGLSVCRTIVRAHEGRIWAINNRGRGATLCIELPRAPAAR